MKNALRRYQSIFRKMIEKNDSTPISNESRMHAAIIIQELVRSAQNSVYIQCSRLAPDVYGNPATIEAIKDAIKRGVEFKIAVRTAYPEAKELYEIISEAPNSSIQLNCEVYRKDFCVVDGIRERFEIDAVLGKALVCAYDPEWGAMLVTAFDRKYPAA